MGQRSVAAQYRPLSLAHLLSFLSVLKRTEDAESHPSRNLIEKKDFYFFKLDLYFFKFLFI